MRHFWSAVLFVVSLSFSPPASAWISGNDYLQLNDDPHGQALMVASAIEGFAFGLAVGGHSGNLEKRDKIGKCISGWTPMQMRAVLNKALEDKPTTRHWGIGELVGVVLAETCLVPNEN